MVTFNPAVYEDTKIKETLAMLAQGKSKEYIVTHFGNKNWSSVDVYFRRRGFRWNGTTFEPVAETSLSAAEEAKFIQTKAAQIVRQLSVKHADIRQIAIKNGFPNVEELSEYMKSQGYVWDSTMKNYTYDETSVQKAASSSSNLSINKEEGLENYQHLLDYLLTKKERLFELLEIENNGTLPRYKFKGAKANKTLGIPTSVQTLLNDFSKEFNVTQRDIIEIALAEFFKKYGYEEQLNQVLLV